MLEDLGTKGFFHQALIMSAAARAFIRLQTKLTKGNVKLVVNATMKKCSGKPAAYSKNRAENDVSIGAYSAS